MHTSIHSGGTGNIRHSPRSKRKEVRQIGTTGKIRIAGVRELPVGRKSNAAPAQLRPSPSSRIGGF
jgi:hypothetical protein